MKKNETLVYELANVNGETVTMSVHLHRTPAMYWRFSLSCDQQTDIADAVLIGLGYEYGFLEKLQKYLETIPRSRKIAPKVALLNTVYCDGNYFPDREYVIQLIETVFLPCWRYAVGKILEFREAGESWYHAVLKAQAACIRKNA